MNSRLLHTILFACALLFTSYSASTAAEPLPKLREVQVQSSIDKSLQPCRFWIPEKAATEPVPLIIFLHSWSGDYRLDNSKWLRQAVDRDWIYLHPNFRGRNDDPQACGSELAQQDILDGLDWISNNYSVDPSRIYLAGVSGGGHMAMLMAGRHSDRFSAVSAWVGISDLAKWYRFHCQRGTPGSYAQMIAASCGGAPGESPEVDAEYHARSPIHWMRGVGDLPLDLNAGVTDGKTGSVPPEHTLRAFNEVARAGGYAPVTETEITQLWNDGQLAHPQPQDTADDPTYGRQVHLRRHAGPTRVTIFQGGHESHPEPAYAWLERQSRRVADAR